ncbi:MAG: nucleotide exchange factor GrpE [Ilumatobacteraceae bacterium]
MTDDAALGEDERGSEVDDYTAEVPTVETDERGGAAAASDGPTGFGDGDVADVEIDGVDPVADLDAIDVGAVVAERDELRALAVRLQADFENFRRRTSAQAEADIDRATGRLAEAFLPVLDAAEAAFVRHPDEVGPLLNVMLGELKKHGLESVAIDDEPFDPEVAEAVAHTPGVGGEIVVAEVLRSGYRWRGRTLRPAMVRTTD